MPETPEEPQERSAEELPENDLTPSLAERVERQDKAIRTMAHWLVQAQTGFGEQDVRGIEKILDGER